LNVILTLISNAENGNRSDCYWACPVRRL